MERIKLSLKRQRNQEEINAKKIKTENDVKNELPEIDKIEEFKCEICGKNITHMNLQRRTQHINKCADEQVEVNSLAPLVIYCPFCRKDVSQINKMTHLKVCGREKGVTEPVKLLEVYKLMHRQAEENRAMGIPAVPAAKPKPVNRTKGSRKMDPDLQAALAMSLSLKEENDRKFQEELLNLGIPTASSSNTLVSDRNRKRKQKEVLHVLLTRTPKEREELLQAKISQILDEENEMESLVLGEPKPKSKKIPILWRKSACPDVVFERSLFYVSQLRPYVSPSKIPIGAKRKVVSDIPGRGATQIPIEFNESERNDEKFAFETEEIEESVINASGFFKQISEEEIGHVDYLMTDYGSMVGNPELSDVKIETEDDVLHAHRFVFLARCLPLYEETRKFDDSMPTLKWSKVSTEAVKAFLTFLYSAQIVSTNDKVTREVETLARKYDVRPLCGRIECSSPGTEETQLCVSEFAHQMDECMSPELLPLRSDEENDLSDLECFGSPEIKSECAKNDQKFITDETEVNIFKYPLLFKPETSTPIDIDKSTRFFSVSTLKDSDEDNVIEATCNSPIISHFSQKGEEILKNDDLIASSFGKDISDEEDETELIVSPIISSISQKVDVNYEDVNSDSVVCLENGVSDDLSRNFNYSRDKFLDSSKVFHSQPVFSHKSQEENELWNDFDDGGFAGDDFSRMSTPLKQNDNPGIDFCNTPILPLAERIKRLRQVEEPTTSNDYELQVRISPEKEKLEPQVKPRKKREAKKQKPISSSQPVISENVTPKPNFTDMNASGIQKQLKKYGLRRLPNKKAIKMLEHIYEGTHPVVTDSEHENSTLNQTKMESKPSTSEEDDSEKSEEMLEETCFLGEAASQPTEDLTKEFKKFVISNPDLHKKVLLYEPVYLHDIYDQAKAYGLKINLPTLKELLDKECITFRLPNNRTKRGKKMRKN